jgi:hypothetical protein
MVAEELRVEPTASRGDIVHNDLLVDSIHAGDVLRLENGQRVADRGVWNMRTVGGTPTSFTRNRQEIARVRRFVPFLRPELQKGFYEGMAGRVATSRRLCGAQPVAASRLVARLAG